MKGHAGNGSPKFYVLCDLLRAGVHDFIKSAKDFDEA